MKNEINRRLDILNEKKVPMVTARMLRGGMQERLHRQEVLKYGRDMKKQKKNLQDKLSLIERERQKQKSRGNLSLIERERQKEKNKNFRAFPQLSIEPLDDFDEPIFRRIRNKRGFF